MKVQIGKYTVETGDVGNNPFSLNVLSQSDADESRLKAIKNATSQISLISKGREKDRQFLAGLESETEELHQARQDDKDYSSKKILRVSISNSATQLGGKQQTGFQWVMISDSELDDFYQNICELARKIAVKSYLPQRKGFWGKLFRSLTVSIGSPMFAAYHIGKLWKQSYDVVVFECAETVLVSESQIQKYQPHIEINEEEYPIDLFEQILQRFYLNDNQL
ncbi:hypothetical protein [Pseudanabaena sp. 'Roaring Creek']|uniref:hypothetical protein n=1 Tax=Pseudanabaena sp. 'Roaring Creek' TaxID=1681830 RepID=UPI0006D84E12|nr:hypothetical protein [Pseudanabaena sp. 'Roaring Creek']